MATSRIERFEHKVYVGQRTTQQHSETLLSKICNEIALNANLHFSHYKSMGTLSCHSNQST